MLAGTALDLKDRQKVEAELKKACSCGKTAGSQNEYAPPTSLAHTPTRQLVAAAFWRSAVQTNAISFTTNSTSFHEW